MYLPDNVQNELRSKNLLAINEVVKKEGDLYIAVNVVDQQRRIVNIDHQIIESLMNNNSRPGNNRRPGGLLKG